MDQERIAANMAKLPELVRMAQPPTCKAKPPVKPQWLKATKFSFISRRLAVDILDDSTNRLLAGHVNGKAHSPVTSTQVAKANDYSQTEGR